MTMKTTRSILLPSLLILTILGCIVCGVFAYRHHFHARTQEPLEHWMVVFVHGSFNFPLSLLNIVDVFNDTVENSYYSKVIKKMRKDPYFHQEQPISQRGLVHITPTLTPPENPFKFAAYPLIACYDTIDQSISETKKINHYYTFGWSGLLSQRMRRKEATRFYNALSEECAQLLKKGICPKIRLIAHSHGGNVCLNLGAIQYILTHNDLEHSSRHQLWHYQETETALSDLHTYIAELPSQNARPSKGQKRYDYAPTCIDLVIDELILLGNPIQRETIEFATMPIFRKLISFYSPHDTIQGSDFISTKQRASAQRIPSCAMTTNVNQFKISVAQASKSDLESCAATSWWPSFFQPSNTSTNNSPLEPSHKDLWFLAWNQDHCHKNFPLNPLPLVILLPLLMNTAPQETQIRDGIMQLEFGQSMIQTKITELDDDNFLAGKCLQANIINELRAKIMNWQPDNLSKEKTFQAVSTKL